MTITDKISRFLQDRIPSSAPTDYNEIAKGVLEIIAAYGVHYHYHLQPGQALDQVGEVVHVGPSQ